MLSILLVDFSLQPWNILALLNTLSHEIFILREENIYLISFLFQQCLCCVLHLFVVQIGFQIVMLLRKPGLPSSICMLNVNARLFAIADA
jgi:hypothetical protein